MLRRQLTVRREVGSYAAARKPIIDAIIDGIWQLARGGAFVLAGVAVLAAIEPRHLHACSETMDERARIKIRKLAYEGYPDWRRANPDQVCPRTLANAKRGRPDSAPSSTVRK